jgi:exopolyphosphatase/guanosine-5'-triphosphate,3'-diphosphate pyrophosphatase
MKQAIIDIGSNSMRLTLYEIAGRDLKILFKAKNMAGLARYVEKGALSDEGIDRAVSGLLTFKETLASLEIKNVAVFATASLRNILNTDEAVASIRIATGYPVEVISGETEAQLGYMGAMRELHLTGGAFFDVGGASTEIVSFSEGIALASASFRVGSLSLYRECVKKILPGKGSQRRIRKHLKEEIDRKGLIPFEKCDILAGVGGTARAVHKLCQRYYHLPLKGNCITREQLFGLSSLLCQGGRTATDLILKLEPERIHTIVPGIMILVHLFELFDAKEMVVSQSGVREGYLCQKVLAQKSATPTAKTEN